MGLTRPFSETLDELRKDEDFIRAERLENAISRGNQSSGESISISCSNIKATVEAIISAINKHRQNNEQNKTS